MSIDISKDHQRKIFIFFCGFLIFFFSAFKSKYLTSDTFNYALQYIKLDNEPWRFLLQTLISGKGKSPLFYIFSKIFVELGFSVQVWYAVISLLFAFSASYCIYRYSKEPYLSFIMLTSLGYYFFSMTALKQTVSISFVLLSFKFLHERKLLKFIFIILATSLFHTSAVIFLLAYPISRAKVNMKHILAIPVIFLTAPFISRLLSLIWFLVVPEYYYNYSESNTLLTLTGFLIQVTIFIFCYIYKNNLLKEDPKQNIFYNILIIGVFFQILASTAFAEMFRASMYFSIFSIILVPNVISKIRNSRQKVAIYSAILFVFIGYSLYSGEYLRNYIFCWN